MAKFAGLRDPVTLDFENSTIAYCVDAFSISMGALMGTSPVTAFIESATGISGESTFFLRHMSPEINYHRRGR
jgi:AGZA family xanthine/uracil permease-like MFS transporter